VCKGTNKRAQYKAKKHFFAIIVKRKYFLLWDRVIAGASPRIATKDAPDGEVKTFNGTMFDDGLTGILATSGSETAGRRGHRRDDCLVKADGCHQEHYQETTDEAEHGLI
jgi:hypothetical protein